MRNRIIALAAGALLVGGACAGLEKSTEQFKDAPRGDTNKAPADIITMPDGFSNIASKCDGPNRVYVIFKGDAAYGSINVVPNDPRCSS